MKFRKSSNYSLISECQQYSIAKVVIAGAVQYEAWHVPKPPAQPIALSIRQPTSLECIGICRRHAEQRAKTTA